MVAVLGFVVGQLVSGRRTAQRRQLCGVDGMDAGQRLPALPGQLRARAGQPGVVDDASAERLAGHVLHDIASAQAHGRLQHQRHRGHRHADACGLFDDLRLGLQRDVAGGALGRAFGRTAQHHRQVRLRRRLHDEGPGLLAGAAAQSLQGRNAAGAGTQARRQRVQALLQGGDIDHARGCFRPASP